MYHTTERTTAAAVIDAFWRRPPDDVGRAVAHLGDRGRVLRRPGVAVVGAPAHREGIEPLTRHHAGVVVTDVVTAEEAAHWATAVDHRRDLWDRTSPGPTTTVGAAWFAYAGRHPDADDRVRAYSRGVAAGDRAVHQVAPGLASRLTALTAELLGAPVERRPGWAGPGFVRFAPDGASPRDGSDDGDVHLDWVGLAAEGPDGLDVPCRSFVLMLRPATTGGRLRLWNVGYGTSGARIRDVPEPAEVDYPVGGLLCFDGHLLHQVTALGGHRSRITVTWHVMRPEPSGPWFLWL